MTNRLKKGADTRTDHATQSVEMSRIFMLSMRCGLTIVITTIIMIYRYDNHSVLSLAIITTLAQRSSCCLSASRFAYVQNFLTVNNLQYIHLFARATLR